jgi:hypothetical protein
MPRRALVGLLSLTAVACRSHPAPSPEASPAACHARPVTISQTVAAQADSVTIRGIVRDEDAHPLADVRVQLDTLRPTVTDQEGRFFFAGVPAGAKILTFARVGYNRGMGSVVIVPGQTVSLAVRLPLLIFDGPCSVKVVPMHARSVSAPGRLTPVGADGAVSDLWRFASLSAILI